MHSVLQWMVLSCPFCTFSAIPNLLKPPVFPTFFLSSSSSFGLWALPHGGSVFKYLGQLHSQGFTVAPAALQHAMLIHRTQKNLCSVAGLLRSRRAEMMDGKCCYADSRRRRKSNTFQKRVRVALHSIWQLKSYRGAETHMKKNAGCYTLHFGLPENLDKFLQHSSSFIVTVETSFAFFIGDLKVLCVETIAMIWHLKKITSNRTVSQHMLSYNIALYEYM